MNVVMKVDGGVSTDDMFAKSAMILSTTSFSNVGNVDCEPVIVADKIVFDGDQVDHPKALPFRLAILRMVLEDDKRFLTSSTNPFPLRVNCSRTASLRTPCL
jgi:hypothetical protein